MTTKARPALMPISSIGSVGNVVGRSTQQPRNLRPAWLPNRRRIDEEAPGWPWGERRGEPSRGASSGAPAGTPGSSIAP
jgi:hypothetical protein